MLGNLIRAAVSVALTPVAVVADALTLPATAERSSHPFGRTEWLLKNAGQNVKQALRPKS